MDNTLRDKILAQPDVILDDLDVMRALIDANDRSMGDNIVDLRSVAMKRLEARLDRLEDTHRSVIAAAYENLAGTNQVHRAILAMMEPNDFDDFLNVLKTDIADILRLDCIRLIFETRKTDQAAQELAALSDLITIVIPEFVDVYLGKYQGAHTIATRPLTKAAEQVYGPITSELGSEACIKLDLGAGRLPALLCLASKDRDMFAPNQATDLLAFFGGVFERVMRRWLS